MKLERLLAGDTSQHLSNADFTVYVTAQYAAGCHDEALKGGEVCLYLDITGDSGDCSSFAVYSL